ncbi:hypothetical protein SNB94_13220, partial [Escherichia coli]|nr:hypothetical protein [Escherichia coli]
MVNSYSLSDDSGVMAAAAITHFLFGQAVFSYLNGWSVLIGPGTGLDGTVAKLAMRQPFVLFKGLTFQ